MTMSLAFGLGLTTLWPVELKGFPLSRRVRVAIISDSQGAGRGAGSGPQNMDGARALSFPARLAHHLKRIGFTASCENLSEAANNEQGSAGLPLYDPRYVAGTFSVAGGTGIGGYLITKSSATAGGQAHLTPTVPVDTFEIYHPVATYGTLNCRIDSETVVPVNQAGTPSFKKTTIVSSAGLGMHVLNLEKSGGAGATAVFFNTIIPYNSAAKEIQIVNLSARGWSTTDWLVADQPWRAFPALAMMEIDILVIMLGTNDRRTSGAGNSAATYAANLQSIVTKSGAPKVIVALPMPINQARIATFSDAEQLAACETVAANNAGQILRTDCVLPPWEIANAASAVADDLHWRAAASDAVAASLVPLIHKAAREWEVQ
ncbi:MAG: hypothetical protein DI589_05825 [Shinella sp.]|nr:MAG: hypothetical protein DI589_05825 [Shinella sp.]